MRHLLDPSSNLAQQVRSLLVHEYTRALQAITATPTEAVHDLRRCGKRSRAWLRLFRPGLSKELYGDENHAWRDLGRMLSPLHDQAAISSCLAHLGRRYADLIPQETLVQISTHLPQPALSEAQLAGIRADVHRRQRRLDHQSLTIEWRDLVSGHEKCHRAWIVAGSQFLSRPTTETRHTWRKRSKDLAYQLRVLAHLWPTMLQPLAATLTTLGDHLGDERDAALTCQWLRSHSHLDGSVEILRHARNWRRHLRHQCETLSTSLMRKSAGDSHSTVALSSLYLP